VSSNFKWTSAYEPDSNLLWDVHVNFTCSVRVALLIALAVRTSFLGSVVQETGKC